MKKQIHGNSLMINLMVLFLVFLGFGCGKAKKNSLSEHQEQTHNIYKSGQISKGLNIDGQDEAIYGMDDRLDYHAAKIDKKKAADSTVLLTNKNRLTKNGDGSYSLETKTFHYKFKKEHITATIIFQNIFILTTCQ